MELRSRRRRARRPVTVIALLLAATTIAAWAYLNGFLGPGLTAASTPTSTAETPDQSQRTEAPTQTAASAATDTTGITPSSSTPADEWAREILAVFISTHEESAQDSPDGLAWWQSRNVQGELDWVDERPQLDDRTLMLDHVQTLSVLMPDPASPGRLVNLGSGIVDSGALSLAVSSTDSYWLLGGVPPSIAIKALVLQGLSQDIVLSAAFSPGDSPDLQFVLLDFQRLSAPTATATPTLHPSVTVTATRTPTLTPSITPTRQPDPFMLELIIPKIDPVIANASNFNPSSVLTVMTAHPFFGELTWTESGPRIADRPIAVSEAVRLNIFALEPDDPSGDFNLVWTVEYEDGATRFPDDQIFFQERRMDEVLFWMVRHAAARGGQLFVAYDDFGLQQNLIILGFRAFATPTATQETAPTP